MNPQELLLLQELDTVLQLDTVRRGLTPIVGRVAQRLAREQTTQMAWEPVPLSLYGGSLPPPIRSSWVFILRAGAVTGAERHPNSQQRMMSYRGSGDLQTGGEGRWESNPLRSDEGAGLTERWVSVPANVWHQAVVPDQDWVVVSFHTVPADELLEERPDPADANRLHRRHYLRDARGNPPGSVL